VVLESHKVFFAVLISMDGADEESDDAKVAPLGKLSNMQIRTSITKILFLGHNSIIIQDE